MGITAELKSVSKNTLKILLENSPLVTDVFLDIPFLDKYSQTRNRLNKIYKKHKSHDWIRLEKQFIEEWETPELDLHKYWYELTFLLAGYIPTLNHQESRWIALELKQAYKNKSQNDFLSFKVIEKSDWDGLPLVNALGAGKVFSTDRDYGRIRYLTNDQAGQILDGLLFLTEDGFKERYHRESQKAEPCPYIDWSEEEMLDWLTDYYRAIVEYYYDTYHDRKSLLFYLT